ncbi:MAG: MBL fold metallo-hydrolase [Proteobacteria bacterium]|nr:MBL fold metallo-hydrolase [Pseudomonadota bacterium]
MSVQPIPFQREFEVDYGTVTELGPMLRRVVARNPSPFTFRGTGSYIVGRGKVAIIDPGPELADHIEALLAAVEGEAVSHLLVTHTHRDHSPAASHIKEATGAPVYGFGPHGEGQNETQVEEGVDRDFVPDIRLADGEIIEGDGWTIEAIHTPGHTSNHLCFALKEGKVLFPGDHVMGWSTTVVLPPDGDMAAYVASLERLRARDDALYWPTHGPSIPEPQAYVGALIEHRRKRERQIADCLSGGIGAIPKMVDRMYPDLPAALHGAAAQSVLAHLIHMVRVGRARCDDRPGLGSKYRPGAAL